MINSYLCRKFFISRSQRMGSSGLALRMLRSFLVLHIKHGGPYIKDSGAHYYIARGAGVGLKGPLQNQKFSGNAYLTVKKNGAEASVMIEASVAGALKKFAFVSSSCSY